jgi:hypothetical protein
VECVRALRYARRIQMEPPPHRIGAAVARDIAGRESAEEHEQIAISGGGALHVFHRTRRIAYAEIRDAQSG